jgi:hypothetical protein
MSGVSWKVCPIHRIPGDIPCPVHLGGQTPTMVHTSVLNLRTQEPPRSKYVRSIVMDRQSAPCNHVRSIGMDGRTVCPKYVRTIGKGRGGRTMSGQSAWTHPHLPMASRRWRRKYVRTIGNGAGSGGAARGMGYVRAIATGEGRERRADAKVWGRKYVRNIGNPALNDGNEARIGRHGAGIRRPSGRFNISRPRRTGI